MKKLFIIISLIALSAGITSCGGSSKSKQALVTLGELDDFFTVKSYSLESDAEQKGVDNLKNVKGTLTLVVKRNKEEMPLKPSDVDYADFGGEIASSAFYVFKGDCDAAIKQMLKMEAGKEETFTLGFVAIDPYDKYNTEEDNKTERQNIFDALTKSGCLDQITFDIEWKKSAKQVLKALMKMVADDDDD